MTDERYKELMERVGMPNSRSLLLALQQVANEVAQETQARFQGCQCNECKEAPHDSDCAVHNEPATPNGPCDCKSEWISVDDRLPDKSQDVVVYANDIVNAWVEVVHAYVCPEYGNVIYEIKHTGEDYPAIVTHWQKLPSPPTN